MRKADIDLDLYKVLSRIRMNEKLEHLELLTTIRIIIFATCFIVCVTSWKEFLLGMD